MPVVKFKLEDAAVKSREVGEKVEPLFVGVTRYVVPLWKPDWLQAPLELLVTADGIVPLPDTRVNVIVTPETSEPDTVPLTLYVAGEDVPVDSVTVEVNV
jgi:hypothetical protein